MNDPGDEDDHDRLIRGWVVFSMPAAPEVVTFLWMFARCHLRLASPVANHDAGDEDDWLAYVPSPSRIDGVRGWMFR